LFGIYEYFANHDDPKEMFIECSNG
jgi:hypothetical protein